MFQVHAAERALTVETNDMPGMLAKLPSAFQLTPTLLGLPHEADEVTALAYLGIQVPSTIERDYDWPRDKMLAPFPFNHQIITAGFMTTYPHCFNLNGIGTAKTLTAAWAADYLMRIGKAQRVVIVCPLSTLERVWADCLFCHLPHRSFNVLHGTGLRRKKLLAQEKDFYIVNHDGIGVIEHELKARDDIDIVIIDELGAYRNKGTAMWKSLDAVIRRDGKGARKYVWGMTGTPIPNAPSDAFAQCKLITPDTVPKFFTQFQNLVMEHVSAYMWVPRADAIKTVYQVMRPAIRFKREDCVDLPGEIHQTRDVTLSVEQTRHYKEVMTELYTEVKGGKITAVNEGVKMSKLLQIGCGVVYDTAGVPREIDCGNRLDTLMEIIEQVDEKVIVFVPFTSVTTMLHRELSKHWNFEVVTGATSVTERNRIFLDFQNPEKDLDIIAHPKCMSHGLTLTEASTIIWFAPINSNDIYEQANGRIARVGQKYVANIIQLAGSAVERKIYKRLEARQKVQGLLLEMVEANEK